MTIKSINFILPFTLFKEKKGASAEREKNKEKGDNY